jgi:hypothetical protein
MLGPVLRRPNLTPIPHVPIYLLLLISLARMSIRRRGHLRQPTRRRHARLILNRTQQRRETLKQIPNRRHRIRRAIRSTRVPDVDFGLQALDSVGVGVCKTFVCTVCQHEVLHLSSC